MNRIKINRSKPLLNVQQVNNQLVDTITTMMDSPVSLDNQPISTPSTPSTPSSPIISKPSTPIIGIPNITKNTLRIITKIDTPNDNIQQIEYNTISCVILGNEECSLKITPTNIGTIKQVQYTISCDDDLYGLNHYLKPLQKDDNNNTISSDFSIDLKNESEKDRNITINYQCVFND